MLCNNLGNKLRYCNFKMRNHILGRFSLLPNSVPLLNSYIRLHLDRIGIINNKANFSVINAKIHGMV